MDIPQFIKREIKSEVEDTVELNTINVYKTETEPIQEGKHIVNRELGIKQEEVDIKTEPDWQVRHECATKNTNSTQIDTQTHTNTSNEFTYKCVQCDYKTKQHRLLKRHVVAHKNTSEVPMYDCDICDYKTKYKHNISIHMIKHKSHSEATMYECTECDYKTKYKNSLKLHLFPKNKKETVYKCRLCWHETIYKCNLKTHMSLHQNDSDDKIHARCECCKYKTDRNIVKPHVILQRPNPLVIYQCDKCIYMTKRKDRFDIHMVLHGDANDKPVDKKGK